MSTDGQTTQERLAPHLDQLLTLDECATWLRRPGANGRRWLMENQDKIVPFKPSHKTTLYHPRTVLAKMAFDAGVPLQIIAASHGIVEPTPKM